MSNNDADVDIEAVCEMIRKDYSPCDVSDALLVLGVPLAGHLTDIAPLPTQSPTPSPRIVAPVSTVLFVPLAHPLPNQHQPPHPDHPSNLSNETHWTDAAAPGSIVLLSSPVATATTAALVGDIVATRYKTRGIKAVVVDGGARDVVGCGKLCEDGGLQVWSRGVSSVGTSLELKPWATDVEVEVGGPGGVRVRPGDLLVAEAGEGVCCVVPREKVGELVKVLPGLREADEGVLNDVRGGMGFKEALKRWPGHYTNLHKS